MVEEEKQLLLSSKKQEDIDLPFPKNIPKYVKIFFIQLWSQIKQTFFEMRKRKLNYLLGLLSCTIVVWMVCISYTALGSLPLVFLRLAELGRGEFDVRMTVDPFMSGKSLNYTRISNKPRFIEGDYSFSSPRFINQFDLYSAKSCKDKFEVPEDLTNHTLLNSTHWKWMYKGKSGNGNCHSDFCVGKFCNEKVKGKLFAIDSNREKRMNFGREWIKLYSSKIPERNAFISFELSQTLHLSIGDIIIVPINNVDSIFRESGIITDNRKPKIRRIDVPFRIDKIYNDYQTLGKFDDKDEYSIVVEFDSLLPYLSYHLHPENDNLRMNLSKLDFYNCPSHIYFNLPNRYDIYKQQVFDDIQNYVVKFGSNLNYLLGFNQINSEFKILEYLYRNRFTSLFVGLIVNIIITVLSGLSIILIYSLLLINVETRTFELGVMRMLGMTKFGIISIVLLQSFSYSLPGLIIGLIFGQLSYFLVNFILVSYLQINLGNFLSYESIILSSILGFLIPIFSSILPIYSALGVSLRESLDTTRSKTNAVTYKIERNGDLGINWIIVIIGSLMSIFGFSIHYFLPLALISFNIRLLLIVFFGILISMKFGLTILALNLENLIERILCFIFFFWENYAIRSIITKNLIAHRIRNRKTTIMYAASLGFIIFVSVSFDVQTTSTKYQQYQKYGTRLKIEGYNYDSFNLNKLKQIEDLLNSKKNIISNYAYMSFEFAQVTGLNTTLSNIGRYDDTTQYLYAISSNFYETTGNEFLTQVDTYPSEWDPSRQLYTSYGTSGIILGSMYQKKFKINTKSSIELTIEELSGKRKLSVNREIFKPISLVSAAPGSTFSNFPLIEKQDALISFSSFIRLSKYSKNRSFHSIDNVPIKFIFIGIKKSTNENEISKLKFELNKLGINGKLEDVEDRLKNITLASDVMQFFFIFTTFVSMFMCFFSLSSSMYSNIFEQSKEIGILRAIGARKFSISRIYIYESFILILSSTVMGLIIGTIIAYSFVVQRVLFTQLPIPFVFPWIVVLTVIGSAIIFSILSSIIPIYTLMTDSIVGVMRRLT
eukprot:gene311-6725_t